MPVVLMIELIHSYTLTGKLILSHVTMQHCIILLLNSFFIHHSVSNEGYCPNSNLPASSSSLAFDI